MRVLLTGARAPATLDLARRFHAAGHLVFLADSVCFGLGSWSRAVKHILTVPAPRASPVNYVNALLKIIDRWKIDLLIPTCEEVFFIAHFLDEFRNACQVFTDTIDKLERIHNKWRFSQTLYSHHAKAPESHFLSEPENLRPFLAETYSWVFKPVYSRFASETKIGLSADCAAAIRPTPSRPWIAQRRIFGQEYSTYSVARNGCVQAHATYYSAYKVGLGSGIYFIGCGHPPIEHFVRDFVAKENYTGQIGFDFIESLDGQTWVLEANPRATSGVHLFDHADRLVDSFVGELGECVTPSAGVPRMLGSAMAVYGLTQAIRRRALGTFIRDCWRARDVVFQWSDPLPTLMMPMAFAEIVGVALRERCKLTEAATFDIEWNGEPM